MAKRQDAGDVGHCLKPRDPFELLAVIRSLLRWTVMPAEIV